MGGPVGVDSSRIEAVEQEEEEEEQIARASEHRPGTEEDLEGWNDLPLEKSVKVCQQAAIALKERHEKNVKQVKAKHNRQRVALRDRSDRLSKHLRLFSDVVTMVQNIEAGPHDELNKALWAQERALRLKKSQIALELKQVDLREIFALSDLDHNCTAEKKAWEDMELELRRISILWVLRPGGDEEEDDEPELDLWTA